jgi:hypothetical protein
MGHKKESGVTPSFPGVQTKNLGGYLKRLRMHLHYIDSRVFARGSAKGGLSSDAPAKITKAKNMSAQVPVFVTTTPIASPTASQGDFQTATGYRELATQAAANAAAHVAQAKRFAELGQSELAHVCHCLAQEATRRREGYAANADFFEK